MQEVLWFLFEDDKIYLAYGFCGSLHQMPQVLSSVGMSSHMNMHRLEEKHCKHLELYSQDMQSVYDISMQRSSVRTYYCA